MGVKVEREHTSSEEKAAEIALDHLTEHGDYYSKLKVAEMHMNSLFDLFMNNKDNGEWITVKPHGENGKGTHIFVEEGETAKEAIEKKFGGLNKDKNYQYVEKAISQVEDLMSKKELSKFKELLSKYGDLSKVNLDNLKEQVESIGVSKALSNLEDSIEWESNYAKRQAKRDKFYDFIEKSGFKDYRISELSSLIDEEIKPFEDIKDDLNFRKKLGLKYISDKFSKKTNLSEDSKIKEGYNILVEKMKSQEKQNSLDEKGEIVYIRHCKAGLATYPQETISIQDECLKKMIPTMAGVPLS